MALLVIACGLTVPALQGFFRGRGLESEAGRLLALARYGQNRAVSEGVPMLLWVDARAGVYGLEVMPGYVDEDVRALEYQVDQTLDLEVSRDTLDPGEQAPILGRSDAARSSPNLRSAVRNLGGLPAIRLLPDGFIDELSPRYVKVMESGKTGEGAARWLVQTTNRLGYELRPEEPPPLLRSQILRR